MLRDPPVGGNEKHCWGEGCLEYPSKLAVTRAWISGRKLPPPHVAGGSESLNATSRQWWVEARLIYKFSVSNIQVILKAEFKDSLRI